MVNAKDYEFKISAAGRVNIIGEHIDYCGGKVMPAALSVRNTVYVRRNDSDVIDLSWTTLPDKVSLRLDALESYRNIKYGNYQAGCALLWQHAGHKLAGCDMVQECTVPFGSGLSSSAAIEVSTIAALSTIAGEKFDPKEVALTAQRAEREFVGVNCGIMDQYASACGKRGHAMLLDCKTLDCEYVPVRLDGCSLIIANCNKPHNLVESRYNERRAETDAALDILSKKANISCLADLTPEMFSRYGKLLDGKLYDRVKHVVEEVARVDAAAKAMKRGDCAALGSILNASHASLKDLYEVTGRELDTLAAAAQSHPGCLGSRMTGGGFGGCTISIVQKDAVSDFKKRTGKLYADAIGYGASFYDAEISDGIVVEEL